MEEEVGRRSKSCGCLPKSRDLGDRLTTMRLNYPLKAASFRVVSNVNHDSFGSRTVSVFGLIICDAEKPRSYRESEEDARDDE
jgi:hypothetical protein